MRRPIRPPTRQLNIDLTPEERELIESAAQRDGVSMREVILRAVRAYAGQVDVDLAKLEARVAALEARVP